MDNKNSKASGADSRAAAARVLHRILNDGESLNTAFPAETAALAESDKRLAQAISYGVLRFLPALNRLVAAKLKQPLKGKLAILNSLLLVGAYQLYCLRTKDHAAVSATVEAAKRLKRKNHTGLVNGVLRQLLREAPDRDATDQRTLPEDELFNHPRWFVDAVKHDYPDHWQQILLANNQHPPMWLRVNLTKTTAHDYSNALAAEGINGYIDNEVASAIRLEKPCLVNSLPGFEEGTVSVQDKSAQLAGVLLQADDSHRVLDCCAAPGGKTLHLLETHSFKTPLTAIDVDAKRLQRVTENLARQNQPAEVICADVSNLDSWWDGHPFDRILLDAPCSGTGVIRRHPDIKWLRRNSDSDKLVVLQADILTTVWQALAAGGELLYATCSVLARENEQQINAFLASHDDASLIPINEHAEMLQKLPEPEGGDGFFYARLKKRP